MRGKAGLKSNEYILAIDVGTQSIRAILIDPRGNLIMTYPADVAAKNVRGDLERLLKFAWTG